MTATPKRRATAGSTGLPTFPSSTTPPSALWTKLSPKKKTHMLNCPIKLGGGGNPISVAVEAFVLEGDPLSDSAESCQVRDSVPDDPSSSLSVLGERGQSKVEYRLANDNYWYTLREYMDHYGDRRGQWEWARSTLNKIIYWPRCAPSVVASSDTILRPSENPAC